MSWIARIKKAEGLLKSVSLPNKVTTCVTNSFNFWCELNVNENHSFMAYIKFFYSNNRGFGDVFSVVIAGLINICVLFLLYTFV